MDFEEVTLSVGTCTVSARTARDYTRRDLYGTRIAGEFQPRIDAEKSERLKNELQKQFDDKVLDYYYQFLGEAITKHDFPTDGTALGWYLCGLSPGDVALLEAAIDRLDTVQKTDFRVGGETASPEQLISPPDLTIVTPTSKASPKESLNTSKNNVVNQSQRLPQVN